MSLRKRLLLLAYLLAILLPVFGVGLQAPVYAANPPLCYIQSSDGAGGSAFTRLDSCPVGKLPGGKIEGNEDKCFKGAGSSSGISNLAEGDCAELESASQGINSSFTTNPAGDCGENGDCYCKGSTGECITDDIQTIINVLSVGVGVVATIVIIIAGLQYMTSRDNPQVVQAAKTRILNVIIALVAYTFIYAFLQWVVPGGIFSVSLPLHALVGVGR
jgi:hypothetical protein